MWEEPCVSGSRGSGAIFFSGCALRCSYCQNAAISRRADGEEYDAAGLAELMCGLEDGGAHNINLITAAHFLPSVADALAIFKRKSRLPVVYNTSAYEKAEELRRLDGLVDVYLPDLKYYDGALADRYSKAADYNAVATAAIDEMVRQQPRTVTDGGLIKKGVIVRHLLLPSHASDSARVLEQIAERWGGCVLLSLMRQFTPEFAPEELRRRVTSYEYGSLVRLAEKLGLDGYVQDGDSACGKYTPVF